MEAIKYFGHGHDTIGGVIHGRNQLLVVIVQSGCSATAQSGVECVLPVHGIRWIELIRKSQLCFDEIQDLTFRYFLLSRNILSHVC